jgi:hypothetical protein
MMHGQDARATYLKQVQDARDTNRLLRCARNDKIREFKNKKARSFDRAFSV